MSASVNKQESRGQDFLIGTTPVLTSVLLIQRIHGCCSDTVVFPSRVVTGKPHNAAVNIDRYGVCRQVFRFILLVTVDVATLMCCK